MDDSTETQSPVSRKRQDHLSKDGQWRSFPKVPNLIQYVSNGNYYGRIKVGGRIVRESLKTDVWTTAKLRLADFLKDHQQKRRQGVPPKFGEILAAFKRNLPNETSLKPASKIYRKLCYTKIERSWPELGNLRLDEIKPEACKAWAAQLSPTISSNFFNNILGTMNQLFAAGIKMHKENCGEVLENPAAGLKRGRVKPKDLRLPEPSQFKALVENLRQRRKGAFSGDLVEFLAYSGLRINSEAIWVRWEDIDWQQKMMIVRGHPETGTKNSEIRRVPIIPDMENLLLRMKEKLGTEATGRLFQQKACQHYLSRACADINLTFATGTPKTLFSWG